MSYPTTAPAQVIDIPIKGMNTRNAPLSMDPQTSLWLQDVDTDGQRISVRNGFELFGSLEYNAEIVALGVYGDPADANSQLFAYCCASGDNTVQLGNGDGTFSVVYTASASQSSEAYTLNCGVNSTPNLCFLVPKNDPAEDARTADGTTWAAAGFTSGGDNIRARCACEHNGRIYFFYNGILYYSDSLGAVTGTCSEFPTSNFFRYTCDPAFLCSLSSPGERASETYLAAGSAAGEIIVWGGDYPASSTWSIVGKYKVPPICGQRAAIEINNDIWILTTAGIVSLRALMGRGEEAVQELSPTYNIRLYWNALMSRFLRFGEMYSGYSNVSAAYWPEKDKLFVFVPYWGQRTSPLAFDYFDKNIGTMLVYDMPSQAWTIHKIRTEIMNKTGELSNTSYGGLTYWKNNVYFHCGPNVYRYGIGYMDDADPTRSLDPRSFSWIIEGAHTTLGNPTDQKDVKGWNVLMNADNCSSGVQLMTSIDFSRVSRPWSNVPLRDGINSTNILNGGMGTEFNWTLMGVTNADIEGPVELYSMGVLL